MENIYTILKNSLGVEVDDAKKSEFEKALFENYKTVAEVNTLKTKLDTTAADYKNLKAQYDNDISTRDTDLASLKEQLENAGNDKDKLQTLQTKLETLTTDYNNAKNEYENKLNAQKYEYIVKDQISGLKFSSNSAKKAFMADLMEKQLQLDGDKLLGFDDFIKSYKEQDAGAFVTEPETPADPPAPKPVFTLKSQKVDPDTDGEEKELPVIW